MPKNDFTGKIIGLTNLQKLPKNVGDLGKFIVTKGFKSCPNSNKSPNQVPLIASLILFEASDIEKEILLKELKLSCKIILTN